MTAEMSRAMAEAWIKGVLVPFIKSAASSAIPTAEICGILAGALVGITKKAGWTQQQLLDVVSATWEPAEPAPKAPPPA